MKRILLPTFLFLFLSFATVLNAQTIVNKAWQDTTGHPNLTLSLLIGTKDANGNLVLAGNTYQADSEYILLTKYNSTGGVVWQSLTSGAGGTKRGVATHLTAYKNDLYMVASVVDSATGQASWNTYKFNIATGASLWTKKYTGTYNGYNAPASVIVDTAGYVYTAGTEQTNTSEYEITVIKYDSLGVQKWIGHYDTTGYYSSAIDLAMSYSTNTVVVTGFSGVAYAAWDFLTSSYNISTGTRTSSSRVHNGAGSFISRPSAIAVGSHNTIFIVGPAASTTTGNVDFKLIKYDSLFNQLWVKTWGASDSLDDEPAYMVINPTLTTLTITGYTTHTTGQVDLVTMAYDINGNLLWTRKVNNGITNSALKAAGNSIVMDNSNNSFVTGKMYNGSNYDIVTMAFDPNGSTLWQKTYDAGGTSNDIGMNVSLDTSNNVYVSGTSATATTTNYITMMYSQLKYIPTVVASSPGIPRHVANEVIVRFKKSSIINPSFFAKTDAQFSTLGQLIDSNLVAKMDTACNAGGNKMRNWTVERLFTGLTSNDTLSISRRNDTLRVPDFWATLVLHTQKTVSSSSNAEVAIADSLKKLSTSLVYSELNYIGHLDGTPNDALYDTFQRSLHYNPSVVINYSYRDGHIRADSAWSIESGKRFVKVGVFDSGLDFMNPDFTYTNAGGNATVFKNGWDYAANVSLWGEQYPDTVGHGTSCAGIIGAVTNNSIGISGIAGGWYNPGPYYLGDDTNGVSLYGAKITSYFPAQDSLIILSHAANAIITASINSSGQQTWGVNVINNSWGIDSLETPGYFFSTNEYLLRDAVHFANRQQVVFVASRGNTNFTVPDYTFTHLPACYDTSWVLNVGGSDDHGQWSSESLHSGGVDLVAPCEDGIFSTYPSYEYFQGGSYYGLFGGTSAAAPHVAGVASLLLSYFNNSVADYANLSQEDVEAILERSVRDITTQSGTGTGYDSLTGYGFLLADSALMVIKKPNYYIKHFGNSHGVTTTFTDSLVSTNTVLQFNESTQASNQYNIAPFTNYKCDVYKIKAHVSHSLAGTEQIKSGWSRHSASNTANLYSSSKIWPHERVLLNGYTTSYADLSNYVYKVKDTLGNFLGWYPSDTNTANTKLEYSLLIYNPALTEVQKVEDDNNSILVFPNPSKNSQTIELNLEKVEQITIQLYDVQGRLLGEVFNGLCDAGRTDVQSNISRLANGIYLYRVQAQTFAHSIKFNKM